MEAFETFEHAGFTVELHTDEDPMSPADWDQLGTLYSFERGDELVGFGDRSDTTGQVLEAHERGRSGLTIRYLEACGEIAVLFQYQDYGSSGARMHALDSDDDDAATGYISTTPARILELCGPPQVETDRVYAPRLWPADGRSGPNWEGSAEDWIRGQLRAQLAEWDAYVLREVVGYVVRDAAGEVVSSCWGFYPEYFTTEERARYDRPANDDGLEYVRVEARDAAEHEQAYRARRAVETGRGWAWSHGQREAMPV